jgi:ubiquitin-like-conjugating enzyme ATG3
MENHPILNMNYIGVHPCKHAHAMKKMFMFEMEKDTEEENAILTINKYLVHFLKFVSCVIPQMGFDLTKI